MWFVIQKNDNETYVIQTYTEKMGCKKGHQQKGCKAKALQVFCSPTRGSSWLFAGAMQQKSKLSHPHVR